MKLETALNPRRGQVEPSEAPDGGAGAVAAHAHLRIGTAAWSIPREHAPGFPAEGSTLARYAARLPAVEINTSFYRPHRRATYERWAATVPPGFRFAVKVPKAITHERRLADSAEPLDRFLHEATGLGEALGPLLVQLPPSLRFDPGAAERFFGELRTRHQGLVACEPRHPSWFGPEPEALLRAHRVARVAADPAPVPDAAEPGGWSGLVYHRLHGSPRMYWSAYGAAFLEALASRLVPCSAETWCIFDNTAAGAALGDALSLAGRLAPA